MNQIFIFSSNANVYNVLIEVFKYIVICLLLYFVFLKNSYLKKEAKIVAKMLFYLGIFIFTAFFFFDIFDNYMVIKSLKDKSYKVIEGKIKDVHIRTKTGKRVDYFIVNNKKFNLDWSGDCSFNTIFFKMPNEKCNPLKDGKYIKIKYINLPGRKHKIIDMRIYNNF